MGKKGRIHILSGTYSRLAALVYVYVLLPCDFHVSYFSYPNSVHDYAYQHKLVCTRYLLAFQYLLTRACWNVLMHEQVYTIYFVCILLHMHTFLYMPCGHLLYDASHFESMTWWYLKTEWRHNGYFCNYFLFGLCISIAIIIVGL